MRVRSFCTMSIFNIVFIIIMIIMCVNLHLGDDELDWFQNKNMIGLKLV